MTFQTYFYWFRLHAKMTIKYSRSDAYGLAMSHLSRLMAGVVAITFKIIIWTVIVMIALVGFGRTRGRWL